MWVVIIIQIIASFSTSLCAYRYIPGIKSIIFKFSLSYVCVQKELRFYSIPMYSGGSSHIWTKERDLGWWPSKRSPEYINHQCVPLLRGRLKAMGTSNIATWYQVTVMKIQSLWVTKAYLKSCSWLALRSAAEVWLFAISCPQLHWTKKHSSAS